MGKEKPINFAFRFLTAASDEEQQDTSEASIFDLQESLKTAPDPFEQSDASGQDHWEIFNNAADSDYPDAAGAIQIKMGRSPGNDIIDRTFTSDQFAAVV
ncbi:hypothetical protein [Flavobacterium humidisoli]|uniref:Uncharacterized protein n=1 Tax=Flavobacterium humidisoli TaxID=2937442 RepID=A0ABY4LP30_9FLAO|nr:hypothetical protein [Flavobacterium humidisoli]UPZ14843.1 hypothetical protein M0M44_19030 [Flavobacterium humidisoli]